MSRRKRVISGTMTLALTASLLLGGNITAVIDNNESYEAMAATSSNLTLADMPASLKDSVEWVWNNRIVKERSTERKNIIFDQIFAGNGTLNYVVRWQSSKPVTLQQRKDIEIMLSRQINNWTKNLIGYDGWPFKEIKVKVVGWACTDASLILDKQSDEIVYTDYIHDDLSNSNSSIPAELPCAPSSLSRAEHFEDYNYSYPGGLDKRFDMYLWGTTNFQGGAGGDWGQRISDDYILLTVNSDEVHIIEHEMGHGFGMPDFYEDADRPPSGFPMPTIMWAGNSATITEWDVWLLRYIWSQLKQDTSRFPNITVDDTNDDSEPTVDPDTSTEVVYSNNIASKATVTSSFCSDWESINALNDGYDPSNSNDRAHDVYGNWPQTGTQWVKYTFDKNYTISKTDLYWFKDGAGIDVPSSYKIKYWNGSSWVEVSNASGLGNAANQYNSTSFNPITTNAIMIEMNSNGSYSTGILEWKVYGEEAGSVNTPIETPDVDNSDKPALTSGDIKIEAYNSLRNALSNTISPLIKITNTSNEPLDLSKVSLRYYYTADGASSQNYWCDWSSVGSQNVKSKFVTSSSSANADNYLEISFTSGAGTLAPGSTAFINGRISKGDWSNYNQSNDYSFNSSDNSYVESGKIPVYVNGQLIAGVEP